MVRFLVDRPIAVAMVLLSILLLGAVAIYKLPVALMPDIDIPEITVVVHGENMSARDLESSTVAVLRRELMQVSYLEDLKSETRNEQSVIHLIFEHGAPMDYIFIEVNEKIDRLVSALPSQVDRPKAIKSNASDIPVFNLNLMTKADGKHEGLTEFRALSDFASQVIRKRIEQLPSIAMVDLSGLVSSGIYIIPDRAKLAAMGMSIDVLESAINNANVSFGNLLIRNGQYEYNVRMEQSIADVQSLKELIIEHHGQLRTLGELAIVEERVLDRKGMVTIGGSNAVTMSIIQQGDAKMSDLKQELFDLVEHFRKDYPKVTFEISHDQTAFLDFVLSNLQSSLAWGLSLAFLVMFFFMKDFRSPFLIGLSVPIALVVTLLCFFLFDISINVISLSGLILGVGMMIDNSIIVIDNITQYRDRGISIKEACATGTSEVFRPLLSSVLTTCAVFVPLIFLSGVSGALFYDQAMAVTFGLFVSLIVSVTVLPVLYAVFYRKNAFNRADALFKKFQVPFHHFYENGFRWIMRHQLMAWVIFGALSGIAFVGWKWLPMSQIPNITRDELVVKINWNEQINAEANQERVQTLIDHLSGKVIQDVAFVGEQSFVLRTEQLASSEASVYLKFEKEYSIEQMQVDIDDFMKRYFPKSIFEFQDVENVFDLMFAENEASLVVYLVEKEESNIQNLEKILQQIQLLVPNERIGSIPTYPYKILQLRNDVLALYDIDRNVLINELKTAFAQNEIFSMQSGELSVPVMIGEVSQPISQTLFHMSVPSKNGKSYPLRSLIEVHENADLKTLSANMSGLYYPVELDVSEQQSEAVINQISEMLNADANFRAEFGGSLFTDKTAMIEMLIVFAVSLVLLYLILAAQFESMLLPLIVLIEVPIDIAGAFIMLKIFGAGINIMSMIGLVVMSGIIINDSILKIDTINQLYRKENMPLLKALLVAGQRRLKPIIMTSLTTVLALVPVLFSVGMGAELQKPLALVIVGGMTLGVFVSLYFVPLCYFYLSKMTKKLSS